MSQRAWEMEKRYFGGERRNAIKDTTRIIFRHVVMDALTDEPRTATEIASTFRSIDRLQVEPQLERLVNDGEAFREQRRGVVLYRRLV